MSYHGHFEASKPQKQPKKKKGKKILIVILIVLAILIAGIALAVTYLPKLIFGNFTVVQKPTLETTAAATELTEEPAGGIETTFETEETTVETTVPPMTADDIINILVIGQASRGGEDAALADSMILVSVNKYNKTMTLSSFLRDTYVDLPDYRDSKGKLHTCGWNKLTTCYALGYSWGGPSDGMGMLNQCLYNNFGIEVDYNFEVNFDCFIRLIDILGGVGIEITQAEADYLNKDNRFVYRDHQAGRTTLEGSEALSYARMRKAEGDSDSDIKRTERQRKLIKALLNNIKSLNLEKIQAIMKEVLPLIVTDMTPDQMTDLLIDIMPILPDLYVTGGTCPVSGTYWSDQKETPDGWQHVLVFEAPQQKRLMRAITEAEGIETMPTAATESAN